VAIGVVEVLELVDVGHQASQRFSAGLRMCHQPFRTRKEGTPVEATRHRIAVGQHRQLFVLLLDLVA